MFPFFASVSRRNPCATETRTSWTAANRSRRSASRATQCLPDAPFSCLIQYDSRREHKDINAITTSFAWECSPEEKHERASIAPENFTTEILSSQRKDFFSSSLPVLRAPAVIRFRIAGDRPSHLRLSPFSNLNCYGCHLRGLHEFSGPRLCDSESLSARHQDAKSESVSFARDLTRFGCAQPRGTFVSSRTASSGKFASFVQKQIYPTTDGKIRLSSARRRIQPRAM